MITTRFIPALPIWKTDTVMPGTPEMQKLRMCIELPENHISFLSPNRGLNAEGILRWSPTAAVAAPSKTDALVRHARRRIGRSRGRAFIVIIAAVVLFTSAVGIAER
jgi:hypothetical protein